MGYEYVNLLRYDYDVLRRSSSPEFAERIQHIERIHNQITVILCEIVYATLKCTMKCVGELVLYKDHLEEKWLSCGNSFDQDVICNHEDALLNMLRDSGYNMSFIVDDLRTKIKSEFKEYSSMIYKPLLEGIATCAELSLNCICLVISQFVFDDGQFPQTLKALRESFVAAWEEPLDHYIADFTECIFYILYQSAIGLVHTASYDLMEDSIYKASSSSSHASSLWYQIVSSRGQKHQKMEKYLPEDLRKNLSVKDILDLVLERTLSNVVDENMNFVKLECEKRLFNKFARKEKRLFGDTF